MKRNNILIWISVLFLALVFSACYDDESTYDTNIIPEVVIDGNTCPSFGVFQPYDDPGA